MSRSATGLTSRQSRYLNALTRGQSQADIRRELKLAPHALRRWMEEDRFVRQWELCNKFLALCAESETHAAAIRAARAQGAAPAAAVESQVAAADSQAATIDVDPEAPPAPAEAPPPKSERDRLLALHGEATAQSFDRLVALRRKLEQQAASPPGDPPPSPPAPPDEPAPPEPAASPAPPAPTAPPAPEVPS